MNTLVLSSDFELVLLGVAIVSVAILLGLVKLNLWWFHRTEGSDVRSIYLVVLALGAVATVAGVLNAIGYTNDSLAAILYLTLGIVSVLILRRLRIKRMSQY